MTADFILDVAALILGDAFFNNAGRRTDIAERLSDLNTVELGCSRLRLFGSSRRIGSAAFEHLGSSVGP